MPWIALERMARQARRVESRRVGTRCVWNGLVSQVAVIGPDTIRFVKDRVIWIGLICQGTAGEQQYRMIGSGRVRYRVLWPGS